VVERAVIREARPEDDAAIGELLVEAFVTQYARNLPEVVYTEERKSALRDVANKSIGRRGAQLRAGGG